MAGPYGFTPPAIAAVIAVSTPKMTASATRVEESRNGGRRVLSDEQVAAYSTFVEVPSLSDLEKFFFLDAFDRDLIAQSRQDSTPAGGGRPDLYVRYKGLFLEDPLAVPWAVVDYLAEQLGVGDASEAKRCAVRPQTWYGPTAEK